jgi:hypothetical protein
VGSDFSLYSLSGIVVKENLEFFLSALCASVVKKIILTTEAQRTQSKELKEEFFCTLSVWELLYPKFGNRNQLFDFKQFELLADSHGDGQSAPKHSLLAETILKSAMVPRNRLLTNRNYQEQRLKFLQIP